MIDANHGGHVDRNARNHGLVKSQSMKYPVTHFVRLSELEPMSIDVGARDK